MKGFPPLLSASGIPASALRRGPPHNGELRDFKNNKGSDPLPSPSPCLCLTLLFRLRAVCERVRAPSRRCPTAPPAAARRKRSVESESSRIWPCSPQKLNALYSCKAMECTVRSKMGKIISSTYYTINIYTIFNAEV